MKNKLIITGVATIALFAVAIFLLFNQTGFLQEEYMDVRDAQRWNYSGATIAGSEAFTLLGNSNYCWILIHSYTATPKEMETLGHNLNVKLNDTVYAIRLSGHGQLPSKITNKSLDIWYEEVEDIFNEASSNCSHLNVVGAACGAALAMKLAEENELSRLYLVNPLLSTRSKALFLLFSDQLHYIKKKQVAQINDEHGLSEHIAYLNMPLTPIKNSFSFLNKRLQSIDHITEPTLILHSVNDRTSSPENAEIIFDKINNPTKKIVWFNESNHILLMDYDRESVVNSILEFELSVR